MKVVVQPVKEASFKKLFDIPLDWYKENSFLRSVRYQYGRFNQLTEKQLEAFKKTVKELKEKSLVKNKK